MGQLILSPSKLSDFAKSPRAAWLAHHRKIRQPDGIRSSLPNAIDSQMKTTYDGHRRAGTMPPGLESLAEDGWRLHPDLDLVRCLRNWRSAPVWTDPESGVGLRGALDDLILHADGRIAPLDVKTTRERDYAEYARDYYVVSQSAYGLILQALKTEFGVEPASVLAFHSPIVRKVSLPDGGERGELGWSCAPVWLPHDYEIVTGTMRAMAECLAGPLPAMGEKDAAWHKYAMAYVDAVMPREDEAPATDANADGGLFAEGRTRG